MEQDPSINKCIPQSLQSTNSTTRTKRPYKKIPQDLRSQILHSLTVDKLPLQEVGNFLIFRLLRSFKLRPAPAKLFFSPMSRKVEQKRRHLAGKESRLNQILKLSFLILLIEIKRIIFIIM